MSFRLGRQPDAFERVKRVSVLVIVLSALMMLSGGPAVLFAVMDIVMHPANFRTVDLRFIGYWAAVCAMASWGVATGVGLRRKRPWARRSILIFNSLLCASVAGPFARSLTMPKDINRIAALNELGQWFVFTLFLAVVGISGLCLFMRKDVRALFARTEGSEYPPLKATG
ncbi:MAG TPA: hypothetical protein VEJ46_18855 [Candidatus Acidoferrum sp.]|nr:hypothetical protein [Candidatus Acidoferrum sp.]